eukprot:2958543-Rhodomonas_salina.1
MGSKGLRPLGLRQAGLWKGEGVCVPPSRHPPTCPVPASPSLTAGAGAGAALAPGMPMGLSLIHISEPTRPRLI